MNTNPNVNTDFNMKNAVCVADLETQIQRLSLKPAAAATKIQAALRRWRLKHGRPASKGRLRRVAAVRLQHVNAKLACDDLPAETRARLVQRRANLTARLSLRSLERSGGGKGHSGQGHLAGVARLSILQGRLAALVARLTGESLSADERLLAEARHVEIASRVEHLQRRLEHGKGFGKGKGGKGHGRGKGHHGKGFGKGGKGVEPGVPVGFCLDRGHGPLGKLPEEDAGDATLDEEGEGELCPLFGHPYHSKGHSKGKVG